MSPFLRNLIATFALVLTSMTPAAGQKFKEFNHWLLQSNSPDAQPLSFAAEVGVISLNRSGASNQPIVFDQDFNEILNANQLDGGFGEGIVFRFDVLNVARNRPIDFSFEMFSVERITSRIVEADAVIPYFFDAIPINPVESEFVNYVSDLQNYEFNFRHRGIPGVQLLAGLRYFEVDETFDVFHPDAAGNFNRLGFYSTTRNEMIGPQFGLATTFWTSRVVSFYGSIKYAFMRNYVGGRANALDAFGNSVDVEFTDDAATNLVDVDLGGYAAITNNVGLKAGYRGLYAQNIAVGPNQSAEFHLFGGPGNVDFSEVDFHGFYVSLEAVW